MARPRIEFTDEQIAEMEKYALAGCQNNTIATLMDFDKCLIDQRPDIKKLLTKKRAERKYNLRSSQDKAAITNLNPALLIFLGKNELGQSDKQDLNVKGNLTNLPPTIPELEALLKERKKREKDAKDIAEDAICDG